MRVKSQDSAGIVAQDIFASIICVLLLLCGFFFSEIGQKLNLGSEDERLQATLGGSYYWVIEVDKISNGNPRIWGFDLKLGDDKQVQVPTGASKITVYGQYEVTVVNNPGEQICIVKGVSVKWGEECH